MKKAGYLKEKKFLIIYIIYCSILLLSLLLLFIIIFNDHYKIIYQKERYIIHKPFPIFPLFIY